MILLIKLIKTQNINKDVRRFLVTWLLLLLAVQGEQADGGDLDDLETNSGSVSDGVTRTTATGNQDLVVFRQVVEATIPWYEGSDLLAVLFQHDSDSLSDSRVRLFRFNTDLFDDEALGHATTHEGVFESRTEESSVVLLVVPFLESSLGC